METTIQKWGNSLAVRLPRELTTRFGLSEGIRVVVKEKKGDLTIQLAPRRRPTLRELVDRVTSENRHRETDWGPPVGKEVW